MAKYSFMDEMKSILQKSQIENSLVSNILIEISNRFGKSNQYINDARYELRRELVMELWETYKTKELSRDNIYSLIARKITFMSTTKQVVKNIVTEAKNG